MTLHEEIIEVEEQMVEEQIVEEKMVDEVEEQGIWILGEYYVNDLDYFGYPEEFFENIDDLTRLCRREVLEEENEYYAELIHNGDYEDEAELRYINRNYAYNHRSIMRLTRFSDIQREQPAEQNAE